VWSSVLVPVGEVGVLGSGPTFVVVVRGRRVFLPGLASPILGTGTTNAADLGQLTSGWFAPNADPGYRCSDLVRSAVGVVSRSAPRSPSTTWRATSDSRLLRLRA
jgi:hypothetical protein